MLKINTYYSFMPLCYSNQPSVTYFWALSRLCQTQLTLSYLTGQEFLSGPEQLEELLHGVKSCNSHFYM